MKSHRKNSKEKTSTLFNRYIWLVETIQRSREITFEEINNLWTQSCLNPEGNDLPLRTFHGHRSAIEEMFDINIECNNKRGYVYYIENELDMHHNGVRAWMLDAFTVGNMLNESNSIKERIVFEQIPSGYKYLTSFLNSIRDNLVLELTYQSFYKSEPYTFQIEPYCLKVFRQRWYVVARNLYHDELRIYSLDRVKHIEITNQVFVYPSDFNPESYFSNSYGIIVEEDDIPQEIEIKVMGNQRKYFNTLPLHHSQTLVEENEEYSVFQYKVHITYDFVQELLSHGASVEILKPFAFRDKFIEYIYEMKRVYISANDMPCVHTFMKINYET